MKISSSCLQHVDAPVSLFIDKWMFSRAHGQKKTHKICVLLRRCHLLNFEFDFMDRAPLLQDCPELHHCLFYQNGSSVNRDFAFIQHCQRNYSIQHICIIHLDQYTNTNMYIYIHDYTYLFTHTHVC